MRQTCTQSTSRTTLLSPRLAKKSRGRNRLHKKIHLRGRIQLRGRPHPLGRKNKKRPALLLQSGSKAPGRNAVGKTNVKASPIGLLLHGTKKKISGNVENGKPYEISNTSEATLLALLGEVTIVYRCTIAGSDPLPPIQHVLHRTIFSFE